MLVIIDYLTVMKNNFVVVFVHILLKRHTKSMTNKDKEDGTKSRLYTGKVYFGSYRRYGRV